MDAMNLLGLTCAVVAALALGVLLGYATCQGVFALLKVHARSLQTGSAHAQLATETPVPQVQTAT